MKTLFTPGPWDAHNSNNRDYIDIDAGIRICSLSLEAARECEPPIPDAEIWANAALIAASPAMFAALEIARATIERLDANAKAKSAQGTLDVINAALASATNLEGK